jgi:NAD-dependent dihydropyrimidine dehydrogenase PreA subunit
MALWFLRGLRRGVVTSRYPARPDPSAVLLPTPPAFNLDRLTQQLAERLVQVCPAGALRREPIGNGAAGTLVLDLGACTACGDCLRVAGAVARPSGAFELAATDRRQLHKRIPIRGPVDAADAEGDPP